MTAAVSISMTNRRLAAVAAEQEPQARATGQFFDLVLWLQRATSADVADGIFLKHAEHIAAIRARKPARLTAFERDASNATAWLVGAAPRISAQEKFGPEEVETMQQAARDGFFGRMAVLLGLASEGGNA